MRTRPPVLLLIVSALFASALGSIAAIAASVDRADACSVAAPSAFATPTDGLRSGDTIEISGFGFYDLIFHEDSAVPPQLCDFDLVPMRGIQIVWEGFSYQTLAVVDGPEFLTRVQVPADADGQARITIRNVVIDVFVGPDIDPPPPPPPHPTPPPPCPLYPTTAQPAPGTDSAPGILLHCPEPCIDYAHTIDDGTVYDYQWDCPDPCGDRWAAPGGAGEARADHQAELAIWCPPPPPPPDPCPLYNADAEQALQDLSIWCPDPCLHYLADDAVASAQTAAVWCPPPPDPCPLYNADAEQALQDLSIWCPDPCLHYLADDAVASAQTAAVWCPGPCELVGGDAWSCPEPLPPEPLPAEALPAEPLPVESLPAEPLPVDSLPVESLPAEPLPVDSLPVESLPAEPLPVDSLPVESHPAESLPAETVAAAVEPERLVVLLAQRIQQLLQPFRWVYFG